MYFTTSAPLEAVKKIVELYVNDINEDVGLVDFKDIVFISSINDKLNMALIVDKENFIQVNDLEQIKLIDFWKSLPGKTIIGNRHLIPTIR